MNNRPKQAANGRRPVIGVPLARSRNERGIAVNAQRPTYVNALYQAGGAPLSIPLYMDDDAYRAIFERLDGLLLAGGEDIHPSFYGQEAHTLLGVTDAERDRVEILLARWAADAGMPLLGICRGHQLLSVALGGTMYQDVQTMVPTAERHDYRSSEFSRDLRSHPVQLLPESQTAAILGERVLVNSLHHQAIEKPGRGLRVVGMTPGGVIETIELDGHPFALGVQWHPEELVADELMLGLFRALVRASNLRTGIEPVIVARTNGKGT